MAVQSDCFKGEGRPSPFLFKLPLHSRTGGKQVESIGLVVISHKAKSAACRPAQRAGTTKNSFFGVIII